MKRNRIHWRFLGLLFTRLRPSYLALTRILTTVTSIAVLSIVGMHTPWAQSLSETLFQMPAQMFFNRGEEAGLAGYDDGGGLVSVLSNEFTLTKDPTWWSLDYPYAKDITLTNLSTVSIATASAQITLNTKVLFDAGKIQNDCDDLRVIYNPTPTSHTELPRSYHVASGASSCADSTVTTLTFPLREPLESGASTSVYRIYYGNPSVAALTGTGYDLYRADDTIVQATLVCPFNGSTTCINQSGTVNPTTATGAIRYSGGSALRFDGINDEILFDATSTLGTTQYTVDVWFKVDDINNTYKRILEKDGNKMMFYVYGSTITFTQQRHTVPQSVGQVSATGVQANTWHRVTVVRNGTNFKIFLDGILKQSTTGADYVGLAGNYRFGYTWGSNSAPISLDEFRLSNIARYSTSFDSYATPFEPDPNTVLLWHFDENGDDPRNTGKAIDSSGNGNHGTITGAKYVSGLVGVDSSTGSGQAQGGAFPAAATTSHQGIFIEEGTTNLITNPSFEHSTYNTNWGTNYFNYNTASATFTPSMAKRNSAGPFAAGPMVQGKADSSGIGDILDIPIGSQINGRFNGNIDRTQGSIVFWVTPEWNGNDGYTHTLIAAPGSTYNFHLVKETNSYLYFYLANRSFAVDVASWTAGTTYQIVLRWDTQNTLDGTNYGAVSINDVHSFGANAAPASETPAYLRLQNNTNAVIEGLTIYRRPLYDGQYGIDVGNGDEIAQIYNSGTGKDPTLVTGSWDVVFALPTNASTGALTTGTGNAWSHSHASNLLYTSTTNTGGFMMNGTASNDGWASISGSEQTFELQPDSTTGKDSDINLSSPTTNYGSSNILRVSDGNHASFISFDFSQIPSTASVNTTTLYLTKQNTFTSSRTRYIYPLTSGVGDWSESEISWNNYKSATAWPGSGGGWTPNVDYVSTSMGSWNTVGNAGEVVEIPITSSVVQNWIQNPLTNSGMRLSWHYQGSGFVDQYYSSDDTTESRRPKIVVMYTAPPSISQLSSQEKIYSGGYKVLSNGGANQGIKYTLGSQPVGRDYVVRAVANSDGTSIPKIQIWDTVNDHEITQLTGTATSTRTQPNVLLFTFELPYVSRYGGQPGYEWVTQDSNQFEVRLLNTESTGTTYWHQVEVYQNLIDNPSFEIGTGDPWVPASYTNYSFEPGEASQELIEKKSGNNSLRLNPTGGNRLYRQSVSGMSVGNFYGIGGWTSGSNKLGSTNIGGGCGVGKIHPQDNFTPTNATLPYTNGVSEFDFAVGRYHSSGCPHFDINATSGSNRLIDDVFLVTLTPVSLTVTPANQANSTETSGLRVDGADTLTQPITGLSADRGVIKFKFTPRHNLADANKYGASFPVIFSSNNNGSNSFWLVREAANQVLLRTYFGTTQVDTRWTSASMTAGTTYDFELSYSSGDYVRMKVNGVLVGTSSTLAVPFTTVPTLAYFGSYVGGGTERYDGTISSFVTLTPTENTTAPYYKFGSKSVKLVNAGSMPDEYTIAIDPNSTATHTLSAYVYDGTTGNVGGTVSSSIARLVFGGSVVTPSAYTDMGGGWWRLTYSAATIDASLLYGVQAQAGKTIYVDGVQLEAKSYATTYADGSLGSGYSWSGTANESGGVRAVANLTYSASGNISSSQGSISLWSWYPDHHGNCINNHYTFFKAGDLWFGNDCGQIGAIFRNAPITYSTQSWNSVTYGRGKWHNFTTAWNGSKLDYYVDGELRVTRDYGSEPNFGSVIRVGANFGNTGGINSTISDLHIFNQALTPSEVAVLYHQGLSTHSSAIEAVDRYVADGTYTSPVIDLGANGAWGSVPWNSTQTLNDGTVTYFTRTSPDNASWSSWEQVLGSAIASASRRYMQWKANMVANELKSQTPKVTGMTVAYVEDTTPPVNPADLALGYTSVASTSATLVSGNFHNFPQPKFTWSAAEDDAASGQSASGVATYHLLMTTDAGATPSAHMSDPCYVERDSDTRSYIVGTAPAACTLTDNTWYLRLQAKDHSGNISSPVTSFVYKYDGTVPDAPAAISSTSVGYSATNSFTFFWPVAQDRGANASGITHYQYKTGGTEGVFSEWQDSNVPGDNIVTQIGGIQAYQQGQNFFFVRSVDRAGNVSAVTTNVAVAPFYYNADAPTAPQNIVISPTTSSDSPAASNVFSVSWDAPETYSGEIAKYYYCVNCTPSATTMTETTSAETVNRVLSTMALATQQGKNTFYLVAEDNNINVSTGHGNRNFEAYASAEFYASTIAPGAPSNLTVSDASDRDASVWRLTLAWKAAATGGTPARYDIYRSTTGDTYALLGNTSSTAYTDADLAQGTIYYYKVRAVDNAGSNSVFSNVVNLAPEGKYTEPPAAGGDPTVSVGSTTATVEWVTSRATFGTVEYGKSTTYGSATAETVAVTNHMLKLKGLAPGTTYHYRVQSLDDSALVGYDRGSAYTKDYTFTTLTAPLISKVEVNDIGLETAVISWTAASLESAVIEYGETTAYGTQVEVSVGEKEGSHTTRLAGLNHSTTYHFRIKGVDIDGNDLVSDDYSFQTIVFPRITAVVLNTDQEESGTTAVLAWASNVPTYGVLEYQIAKVDPEYARTSLRNVSNTNALLNLTQEELAQIPLIPSSAVQKVAQTELAAQHVERIAGLSDGSLYIFTIRGKDKYGNETVSDPIRYVTGADTRPPRINNLVFETPVSGTGAQASAQIIVSWETDEPAFAQVAWGEGNGTEYPRETERSEAPATKHVVVLRDLRPTSSYHLKIIVEDKTGNVAESEDTVVVTPSAQQAAFDIIIRNLEDVFGFLNL
ncbi:MAG TPA: DNRLRE domain-containing protein [Candidatus Woesebacteria bacterium]|nr:DNRLRE domain-containing protein [Candidatus Woesebacteria bacterium]